MNVMQHVNGPGSDTPGISLGSHITNSTGSDIVVRNPPSVMSGLMEGIGTNHIGAVMSSMSLEGLGLDMSLEEAVNKVRELAKENVKLREDAQKNNQTMKQQYGTLSEWKSKWESEREEVKRRHDQAKTVVTSLRDELKKKEQYVTELQLELAQQDEKKCQVTPSARAELLTLEEAKKELEIRCARYHQEMQTLTEEFQNCKASREEQCTEIDRYIKIIRENEQRVKQLERTNNMLSEEISSMKKFQEQNEKLQTENNELCRKIDAFSSDKDKYRGNDQIFSSMGDMSSFVQVNMAHGTEESDSVPYDTGNTSFAVRSCEEIVRSAASPSYPAKQEMTKNVGKPGNFNDESKQKQEKGMSDILSQLQEERTKVTDLHAEIQQKNQEMEALHKKVHKTEELLAESEYKTNLAQAKMKVEHQKQQEELRMQYTHVQQELNRSKALSSSRTSLDSQTHCTSVEEDVKNLRVQVTSLVGELQESNDKFKSTKTLYERQKERLQILEAKLDTQSEDREIQRVRDDELIETLRVTINNLETQLSEASEEKNIAEEIQPVRADELIATLRVTIKNLETQLCKASEEKNIANNLRQDYTTLVHHYQELSKQHGMLKQQFDQRVSGISIQQKQSYEQKVDNLTAQLITAEESMQERNQKLLDLGGENQKLARQLEEVRAENDMVAVHKAQAEVYKTDFDAERKAREEAHTEKERMTEEVNQLIMRNQQLQEELDNLSQNQIAQMQLRHGTAQNRYGAGGGGGAYGGDAFGGAGGPVGYPQQQQVYGNMQPVGTPRQPNEQEEDIFECPKCGEQSPDLDSLQLHVLDCIV